jgi:hypothetical protein
VPALLPALRRPDARGRIGDLQPRVPHFPPSFRGRRSTCGRIG